MARKWSRKMAWLWRAVDGLIRRRRAADHTVEPVQSPMRDTMRMDAALSYASRLTLAQQRARLNTFGPYIWIDRDSHWYPDYISTRCYPDYGFYKIFDEGKGRFNLSVKLVTDRDIVEAELARLVVQARELVLSVVDATDIEPAESYD